MIVKVNSKYDLNLGSAIFHAYLVQSTSNGAAHLQSNITKHTFAQIITIKRREEKIINEGVIFDRFKKRSFIFFLFVAFVYLRFT